VLVCQIDMISLNIHLEIRVCRLSGMCLAWEETTDLKPLKPVFMCVFIASSPSAAYDDV